MNSSQFQLKCPPVKQDSGEAIIKHTHIQNRFIGFAAKQKIAAFYIRFPTAVLFVCPTLGVQMHWIFE